MKLLFILLFIPSLGFSWEITSCEFSKNKSSADIVYSKTIKIKRVEIKEGKVLMPVEENKGRIYENIKLISKKAYENILNSFSSGKCVSTRKDSGLPFKITKVKKLKSEHRIANAEAEFGDVFLAVFGIMKNKDGELWTAFPKDLEVLDKDFESKIKEEIIKSASYAK